MALENDDFDAAFAQFATPDDNKPADAAPAGADGGAPAADGGGDGGSEPSPAVAAGGPDGGGADPAADAGGGDQGASEGAAAPDSGAPAAEGGDAGTGGAPAASAPAAEPAAAAQPDGEDVLAKLSKLVADAKAEPQAQPAAEAPAAQPQELPPIYNQEEQEFLTGYEKDYAEIARGEALKRKAEYRDLLQYVFEEVGKFVAPLKETTAVLAERTHLTDIKTNVPDYSDDLRQQVVDWAAKQPAYLQAAYNHVIEQGTAEEVKDLVTRYRVETGKAAAGAAPTPAKPGKDNELSGEAKQAAAALAPVESKRSGVQAPADPASFDDAWAQFSKPAA
jgi:hypothetical protein